MGADLALFLWFHPSSIPHGASSAFLQWGFRMHLGAAVFSSPFLAVITNQMMLGSNHLLLILIEALIPINDAVVVRSGQRMNSGGTPITFELVLGDIEKTCFNYCLPKYCDYYDYCQQNTA